MTHKQAAEFYQKAKTRNGKTHTIDAVQKDPDGNPSTLKGTVMAPNADGVDVSTVMFWNALNGRAMANDATYDLIEEVPLSTFITQAMAEAPATGNTEAAAPAAKAASK